MGDCMQGKTPKKSSKITEIDQLLGRTASNVSEGFTILEEINITLLQEKMPDEEGKSLPNEKHEPSSGWFDTVIVRLIEINQRVENINLSLSKLHCEVEKN